MSQQTSADAAQGPRESYLGQREGKLTLISVVAMLALVLSYVGFMRAGHTTAFGGFLPKDLAASGSTVYSSKCASCHGGAGGGGVGPALTGGAGSVTFPDPIDQVRWVILGAADPKGAALYTAAGKTATGAMPAWGTNKLLTLTEIVHVVLYERYEIGGIQVSTDVALWDSGLAAVLTEFPDLGFTQADVDALLAEIDAAAAAG